MVLIPPDQSLPGLPLPLGARVRNTTDAGGRDAFVLAEHFCPDGARNTYFAKGQLSVTRLPAGRV